ncbi:MAG TPA: sulfhydrogenase subunit delta [Gammaproteobacteria bacterium]
MKPKIAVHKFASCDGCQLAFLNAGEDLLTLANLVDIAHFAEAGPVDAEAKVDIAFVEGSITTPADCGRIQRIRKHSRYLITIGACATAGGLQALRNLANTDDWVAAVYATPEYIQTLPASTPIRDHVKVDLELWGCPVDARQVLRAVRDLLFGVTPKLEHDKVCLECKRQQHVCVMVSKNVPCMGPVTRTGCGALCPRVGRGCYACFGPAEGTNTGSMGIRLQGLGLLPEAIAKRFLYINSEAPEFRDAGTRWKSK